MPIFVQRILKIRGADGGLGEKYQLGLDTGVHQVFATSLPATHRLAKE